ncbi:MAG: flagellar biosynthesis protein FlhB [Nitrospinae bacterium]|nr:flagellar biosynthesis protein FlhB [Nitrospinota bacterium]
MAEDKDSRTEQPTDKRRKDARKKGQVAKSQELNSFIILATATVFFTYATFHTYQLIMELWQEIFANAAEYPINVYSLQYLIKGLEEKLAWIFLPFMLCMAAVGVYINYWQNDGWLFSWEPLHLKWGKINPITGAKRFIGKEGVVNLAKSLAKLLVIGIAVWVALKDELETLPLLMELPLEQSFQVLGNEAFVLFMRALAALAVIAFADYSYQKWRYVDNMKMTKQEVKDEHKQTEGDPRIKGRIRNKQYEMHRARMMGSIPEAEVIITNPTHLSIALRYDRLRDPAPVVVAKGAGFIALKIREIAKEHNIVMVEDKPLAQTLFKHVDIGETIPDNLYKAVAETLAYVYRLKAKTL